MESSDRKLFYRLVSQNLCCTLLLQASGVAALPPPPPEPELVEIASLNPPPAPAQAVPRPPSPPGFSSRGANAASAAPGDFALVPGFNLVSIPNQPADSAPAAVLGPIDGQFSTVYAHDACDPDDPWKIYDPADPAASSLAAIDHRIGFWIDASAAISLPTAGTQPERTTIELCRGWNLIGYPLAQPRPVESALFSIAGRYSLVFGYDPSDPEDPWEVRNAAAPDWGNDLEVMRPGRGYWVLATEDATLDLANTGAAPTVRIASPAEASELTTFTDVVGAVESDLLDTWTLAYRFKGESSWTSFASGRTPAVDRILGVFDPTLLLNGLYELRLSARDFAGQSTAVSANVVVDGRLKIGHFTLSFLDLAVPLSGLDIEVIRTYDSRDQRRGDFGIGWTLDVRQGSYRNNRTPGEGWRIESSVLPCRAVRETLSHLTVVRLSDREVYRFRLSLTDPAGATGGCFAQAGFSFVHGPLPGSTLEILGNREVVYQTGTNEVLDADTLQVYEPRKVRLTTRDGRIFDLDLETGVTHLRDLNGNTLNLTPSGITHSSSRGISFTRDQGNRIAAITDPAGHSIAYTYDGHSDLIAVTDQVGNTTRFIYDQHHLVEVIDPRGITGVRNDYDERGRLIGVTDAFGNETALGHDLDARREIVTNRLGHVRTLEYDARGNVVRETDFLGNATTRSFDSQGNLLEETDPLANTTVYTYNADNDLISVTDPLGNSTSLTYDARGRLLTRADPGGRVTRNTYDARGNLLSTVDAAGAETRYSYDAAGHLRTRTDALGNVTSFEYDRAGNLVGSVDAFNKEMVYTYDAVGNQLTSEGTWAGYQSLVTTHHYDALGRRVETTYPNGESVQLRYDPLGHVLETIDSSGGRTSFSFDAAGRRVEILYPDSTSEKKSYDAEGRATSFTDRAGRETRFTYDPVGRLLATSVAGGPSVSYTYDAAGQMLERSDPNGNAATFSYDAAGRRTRVVDAAGTASDFTYDAAGQVVALSDAGLNTTRFTYDAAGRLVSVQLPDGDELKSAYDIFGNRISDTDPAGLTTRFAHDTAGRLLAVTDPLGQVTSYAYDEGGLRVAETDAAGHTTRHEYDDHGRETRRILPGGASATRTHDSAGRLSRVRDFAGREVAFSYDDDDRLIQRVYPDGSSVDFTYTASGLRESVTDARGTTRYRYDERDRRVELIYPDGRKLSYGYDENGNRTRLTAHLAGRTLTSSFTYDSANRLQTVTDPEGREFRYSYDAKGNLTSLGRPNGLDTSYRYDKRSRLTAITTRSASGETVQSYALTLGPGGERTRIDESDAVSRAYRYDGLYRLLGETVTDASGPVFSDTYVYDEVGNRLLRSHAEGGSTSAVSYRYDERDRLLSAGPLAYTWNANGELTGKGSGATYSWDFEGRLTGAVLEDGTIVRHAYDADGVRVRSELTPAGGTTEVTDYLVDTAGRLSHVIAESDGNGTLKAFYTRGTRGDELLKARWGEQERYYLADALGSIRALSDAQGLVTDRYTYSVFGELLEHRGESPNLYLFAGEPLDPHLGLYYNRSRWLDPETGRFVSQDPFAGRASEPQTLHRYLYAAANPVGLVDPSGGSYEGLSGKVLVVGMISVLAVASVGLYIGSVSTSSLPPNAFNELPDALILGFGASASGVDLLRWLWQRARNPMVFALLIGLALTGGFATFEVLIPLSPPLRAWLYLAFPGVSIGFTTDMEHAPGPGGGQRLESAGILTFSFIGGFAWGVSNPENYQGSFYCVASNPFRSEKYRIPSATLCSSTTDGVPGAYSATVAFSPFSRGSHAMVQSSWSYYWLLYPRTPSPPTPGLLDLLSEIEFPRIPIPTAEELFRRIHPDRF